MKQFKDINEVITFAINQEQEAIDFYSELAEQAKSNDVKETFYEFVKEEMEHKAKLMKIKMDGSFSVITNEKVQDLMISDYLVPVKPTADMTYQQVLIVAMKKEKAAFKLYKNLSKMSPSEELKDLFNLLALEEASHKLQFEQEYDDVILTEN
ncbi:MAG: rubrerythrin [Bacteroidetes bacterium]|nr:MAG: rubrerythrin [Bacteroidota bacterium]